MKTTRLLPLLLCLGAGHAWAGTPIALSHPATPNTRVSIINVSGRVTVTAWDRNEVAVSGQLGDGSQPLAITGNNAAMSIKVTPKGSTGWFHWGADSHTGSTTLDIHVPKAASLDISVVSAPIAIDGTAGGTIQIDTVSGKARIHAHATSLKVDSISGGIELAGHADQADLQTVSGDMLVPTLGTTARLQTISGRIQAAGGPWQAFTLSTVSGDAEVTGGISAGGHLAIDSMSGDVQLQLPAQSPGDLHASSFSGDLRSDFGTPVKADHGPGSTLDVRLGAGAGTIRVETFSGDLRIRQR